jgi:hypothetical protein
LNTASSISDVDREGTNQNQIKIKEDQKEQTKNENEELTFFGFLLCGFLFVCFFQLVRTRGRGMRALAIRRSARHNQKKE